MEGLGKFERTGSDWLEKLKAVGVTPSVASMQRSGIEEHGCPGFRGASFGLRTCTGTL